MDGRDLAQLSREMCARTTGIGADGVEYLTQTGEREGRIHLYNADGSRGEISGNGTRCVAAWMAYHAGLRAGDEVRIETDAGVRSRPAGERGRRGVSIHDGDGRPYRASG